MNSDKFVLPLKFSSVAWFNENFKTKNGAVENYFLFEYLFILSNISSGKS